MALAPIAHAEGNTAIVASTCFSTLLAEPTADLRAKKIEFRELLVNGIRFVLHPDPHRSNSLASIIWNFDGKVEAVTSQGEHRPLGTGDPVSRKKLSKHACQTLTLTMDERDFDVTGLEQSSLMILLMVGTQDYSGTFPARQITAEARILDKNTSKRLELTSSYCVFQASGKKGRKAETKNLRIAH